MASVVKKGAAFYVVDRVGGRQRWHRAGGSEREAKALALRLDADKLVGVASVAVVRQDVHKSASEGVRASEAVDMYETHLRAAGRHPVHVATTINYCRAIWTYTGIDWPAALGPGDVDRYVLNLRREGVASRTINYRVGAVQALLKWMHGRGLLPRYVLHRYPKQRVVSVERLKRRVLSASEVAKLLACDGIPAGRRLAYRVALCTGLRWSELTALVASWIDWAANVVTIPATVAKERRAQTIPLHPELLKPLERLQTAGVDAPLLAGLLGRRETAARVLRADCRAAGIEVRHVQFHSLRHTFCTLLAASNVHPAVLQALARHASLDTTLRYYVHLRRVDEAAAVAGRLR